MLDFGCVYNNTAIVCFQIPVPPVPNGSFPFPIPEQYCSAVYWSILSSGRWENSNHCDEIGPTGTRLGVGRNGNNHWNWDGNGNETWLNLGSGMGMNHWEREGLGSKSTFPLISNHHRLLAPSFHLSLTECHSQIPMELSSLEALNTSGV